MGILKSLYFFGVYLVALSTKTRPESEPLATKPPNNNVFRDFHVYHKLLTKHVK